MRRFAPQLNTFPKATIPIATWPDADLLENGTIDELVSVGRALGVISVRPNVPQLTRIMPKINHAREQASFKICLVYGAYGQRVNTVEQLGESTFTFDGKEYTFRGGDPRPPWHTEIIRQDAPMLRQVADLLKDHDLWIHVDCEAWHSNNAYPYLPFELSDPILNKHRAIAMMLRAMFGSRMMLEWNNIGGAHPSNDGMTWSRGSGGREQQFDVDYCSIGLFVPYDLTSCQHRINARLGKFRDLPIAVTTTLGLGAASSRNKQSPLLHVGFPHNETTSHAYEPRLANAFALGLAGHKTGWPAVSAIMLEQVINDAWYNRVGLAGNPSWSMDSHLEHFLQGIHGRGL